MHVYENLCRRIDEFLCGVLVVDGFLKLDVLVVMDYCNDLRIVHLCWFSSA